MLSWGSKQEEHAGKYLGIQHKDALWWLKIKVMVTSHFWSTHKTEHEMEESRLKTPPEIAW